MRILTVAHAYPRWDGDVAGAFIERLVSALVARGHAMTVLAPADRGAGGAVARHGATVKRLRYAPARWETLAYGGTMVERARSAAGIAAFLGLLCVLVFHILREWRRGNVGLVHAHWWVPAGLAAWTACKLGGPPYVVTLHGTDVAVLEGSRVSRALARRVLGRALAVTAVSRYLADRATSRTGISRDQIVVRPMPVEVARFTGSSAGGGGVLTIGRLSRQKRVHLVIDAVCRLAARGRRIALTVVGDGPERAALEQKARTCGIDETTRFLGMVEPNRIPQVLAEADVFVFAAQAEGFGLAVAEALLQGVPVVVAADGGGALEAVPKSDAGRIVDVSDAETLADAIAEMMQDSARRRSLAEAASRELRGYLGANRAAQVFEGLYADAHEAAPR